MKELTDTGSEKYMEVYGEGMLDCAMAEMKMVLQWDWEQINN